MPQDNDDKHSHRLASQRKKRKGKKKKKEKAVIGPSGLIGFI